MATPASAPEIGFHGCAGHQGKPPEISTVDGVSNFMYCVSTRPGSVTFRGDPKADVRRTCCFDSPFLAKVDVEDSDERLRASAKDISSHSVSFVDALDRGLECANSSS